MLVPAKTKINMGKRSPSLANKSQAEKPNPRTGGTDRGMTENAGKVPGTRPGNHA